MRLFTLCALSSALFLAACGGGGGSGNGGTTPAPEQFSYVINNDLNIASVSTKTQQAEVVVEGAPFFLTPSKLSANGTPQLAALFTVKDGQLVALTSDSNTPKVISSLENLSQDSFCDVIPQENGSQPRLFFSQPGADRECNSSDDNLIFYVDSSMTADDAPIAVANAALFTATEVDTVFRGAHQVAGYLVREASSGGTELRYYDNLLSQGVTLNTGAGYDANTETVQVWSFYNTDRSLIRLGDEYYDASVANLAAGNPGNRFLVADEQKEVVVTNDRAYLSIGSDYYRHDIGRSDVMEFSTLNLSGSVDIAVLENGSIISSDDNNNPEIRRFLQADERGDSVAFRLLTEADYDTNDTNSSSFGMSSTGRGALVSVSLRYPSTDDVQYTLYIATDDTVVRYDDARWIDTSLNSTSPFLNRPLYMQQRNNQTVIAEVKESNLSSPLVYGTLPAGVDLIDAEAFPVAGKLLLTTRSSQADLTGLVYQITPGQAGSLRQISGLTGFTVGF
ncbi:hypothetical protein [Bacterioplanoides sp.]|uniref:hypothetical protein n=1 Tax=Bacterioplanoides sp. TaxID=2066072 RepID=UPI003AFFF880